jgi:hypothetical protein
MMTKQLWFPLADTPDVDLEESHALSSASHPCPGIGKSALVAENA